MPVILGWDLGNGGGSLARPLPQPEATPVRLFLARDNYYPGQPDVAPAVVEVWGFDPKVTVAVAFSRVRSGNVAASYPPSNLQASIRAYQLVRVDGQVIQGAELSPDETFLHGGSVDADGDDGAEFCTAAQGIRFVIEAIRVGHTSVDLVMTIQARTNERIGCEQMADALRDGLVVVASPPQVWQDGGG
jgi:hypothetical protein